MVTDKILLRRRVNARKVNLLDGRTLYTRYERVSRKNSPANVTIKKKGQLDGHVEVNENNKELKYLATHLSSEQTYLNQAT